MFHIVVENVRNITQSDSQINQTRVQRTSRPRTHSNLSSSKKSYRKENSRTNSSDTFASESNQTNQVSNLIEKCSAYADIKVSNDQESLINNNESNTTKTLSEELTDPVASETFDISTQSCTANRLKCLNGKIRLLRGSNPVLEQPKSRTVAVLAIPLSLSLQDFINFIGSFAKDTRYVRFIENSDTQSWYSALLQFREQDRADSFVSHFDGREFMSLSTEICHVVYIGSVRIHMSDETGIEQSRCIWRSPDLFDPEASAIDGDGDSSELSPLFVAESTVDSSSSVQLDQELHELPNCPVCLERLDASVSGLVTTVCNHSFHRSCLSRWSDSSCPVCRYIMDDRPSNKPCCDTCGGYDDLWMCVICGNVGCGRYSRCHAMEHFKESAHAYSMELSTQRVWDYAGDGYVHRLIQNKTDGKIVELPDPHNASRCSHCGSRSIREVSRADDAHAAGFSSNLQRSRIGPATDVAEDDGMIVKMDALSTEYNALLASQLEVQRDYYEKRLEQIRQESSEQTLKLNAQIATYKEELAHLRDKSHIADQERKAAIARAQKADEQLAKKTEELTFLEEINTSLEKNEEQWELQCRQLQESNQKFREETEAEIADLKSQVGDLMFYLETQQKVENASDELKEEIRGGSIHMAESAASASANNHSRRTRRKRHVR